MSLFPEDLFKEPESFQEKPPEGHSVEYKVDEQHGGESINVHLIGASPLYGHILTHACQYLGRYLQDHPEIVRGKTVLEVGSGGALPSLLSARLGALQVVATDYPDADLVDNIGRNIEANGLTANCVSKGFIWGNDPSELVELLPADHKTFDVIILSDVIFNHSEHYKLLQSCRDLATPETGVLLVTFSPHRPKLFQNDLDFFEKAKDYGFASRLVELQHWSPLFKDDTDESTKELRSRVYYYELTQAPPAVDRPDSNEPAALSPTNL